MLMQFIISAGIFFACRQKTKIKNDPRFVTAGISFIRYLLLLYVESAHLGIYSGFTELLFDPEELVVLSNTL